MEVVEQQLRESAYGGLKAREARLKERHDAHVQGKEADEVLRLAQIKLAEKDALEHASRAPQASSADIDTPDLVRKELDEVANNLPDIATLSVVGNMSQVMIEETPFRKLTAKLQFPDNYPEAALTVHLQSSTLAEGLLERLAGSAGATAAAKMGQPQAGAVMDLLVKFVKGNCLSTAYNDLAQLKEFFAEHNSRKGDGSKAPAEALSKAAGPAKEARMSTDSQSSQKAAGRTRNSSDTSGTIDCAIEHAKQSTGEVNTMLKAGDYYLHVRTAVPRGYPAQPLKIELADSNLPDALVRLEAAKVADMAQKMAEYKMPQSDVGAAQARAGAGEASTSKSEALASKGKQTMVSFNKGQHLAAAAKERHEATQKRREAEAQAFVARPSLFACMQHLCTQFLFPLATGHCPVCSKRLLPADSRKLGKVLKVYCGHHYHYACADRYLSEPPFGKKCHTCGARIEHRALTTDVKVLEARWAAKQAKQRELDEITDFLS